jgi:NAD(P)-dependent dehydrogenase (short-subunit alcohol dehydrogenase family)
MSPTVLVVGANRGLGLHFTLQYLKKGFSMYGTNRKESAGEAKELLGSGAHTLLLDLADGASIHDAARSFGDKSLDLLINCVGKHEIGPLVAIPDRALAAGNGNDKWIDTTAEQFMDKFRVSAVGPFLTTKAFYPQLNKSTNPIVVNISSNSGSISGMSEMSRQTDVHLY